MKEETTESVYLLNDRDHIWTWKDFADMFEHSLDVSDVMKEIQTLFPMKNLTF